MKTKHFIPFILFFSLLAPQQPLMAQQGTISYYYDQLKNKVKEYQKAFIAAAVGLACTVIIAINYTHSPKNRLPQQPSKSSNFKTAERPQQAKRPPTRKPHSKPTAPTPM